MTDVAASEVALDGRARSLFAVYRAVATTAAVKSVQYRLNVLIETVLMAAEPVVYLAVWQIVAREQGGEVDGFTAGRFAAYYITFGLVRTLTQIGSPHNWEYGIRQGRLSAALMRPIHPVHQDLATWMGFGVLRVIAWLPVGVLLTFVFEPEFDTGVAQVVVFPVTIALALVIRALLSDIIGMAAFWLVRIAALMAITSLVEAVMSGRIVPPDLLPGWAQALSWALPYRWTVAFPIETLIGPMSAAELAVGVALQVGWLVAIWLLLTVVWRRGVRRYGAVGG